MEEKIYISRGIGNKFDKRKFENVFGVFEKPYGGLWACEAEKDGWRKYCEETEFKSKRPKTSFKFTLSKDARILKLYTKEDYENFRGNYSIVEDVPTMSIYRITYRWEQVAIDYDVVDFKDGVAFPWSIMLDVDSICVLNPDVVVCQN